MLKNDQGDNINIGNIPSKIFYCEALLYGKLTLNVGYFFHL